MDSSGYTTDHDDEMEENGPENASLAGMGWDILVGGEANAAMLGGDDPFDEDPRDAAVEEIIRMGRESRSGADLFASADEPLPRDLSPEELGAEMVTLEPAVTSLPPEPSAPAEPEPVEPAPAAPESSVVPEEELEPQPEPFERAGEMPFGAAPSLPPAREVAAALPVEEPVVVVPQSLIDARPHDPFAEEAAAGPSTLSTAVTEELPPDETLGALLITQQRIDALWDEINETYNIVVSDVRGHYKSTETAIRDLKRARELLVAGTEHFDNAEELVNRVKSRLRLEEKVRQWSRTHGTWIAIYLVTWLLILFIGSLLVQRIDLALATLVPGWMADTFLPGMYGGLGGVIGALWVLINHIAKKRDFDPIHTPWYITNPFMGIALGVVTYFVLRATSLAFSPEVVSAVEGGNRLGLYLACIIVGFNQNVLWALIDRVIEAIIPQQETQATVDEAAASESNS